jgi:hypothetical protein
LPARQTTPTSVMLPLLSTPTTTTSERRNRESHHWTLWSTWCDRRAPPRKRRSRPTR